MSTVRFVFAMALSMQAVSWVSGDTQAATSGSFDELQKRVHDLVDAAASLVVHIEVGGSQGRTGSGFIERLDKFTSNGKDYCCVIYIVTNEHVVKEDDDIIIGIDRPDVGQRLYSGDLVGRDPDLDIAVVSIKHPVYQCDEDGADTKCSNLKPPEIQIDNSDGVKSGDLVLAVGSPLRYARSVTFGVVSHAKREVEGKPAPYYIQTDAATNPGNSGGPLLSVRKGEVVGVNTWMERAVVEANDHPVEAHGVTWYSSGSIGIGFAIPIGIARPIIDNIIEHGDPRGAYIGAIFSGNGGDVTVNCSEDIHVDAQLGVMINSVEALSPADDAGLRPGDVITKIDDDGEESQFDLIRNCKKTEISVIPGRSEEHDLETLRWPGMNLSVETEPLRDGSHGLEVEYIDEFGVVAGMIRVGDFITDVNGEGITSMSQFYQIVDQCRSETCSLGLYRRGLRFRTPNFVLPRSNDPQPVQGP